MAFWETMEVWQLGELLNQWDERELREGWSKWLRFFPSDDCYPAAGTGGRLNTNPRTPGVCFLVFAALVCESSQAGPDLSREHILAAYHLTGLFGEDPSSYQIWQNSLSQLAPPDCLPAGAENSEAARLEEIWRRLRTRAEQLAGRGGARRLPLKTLLDEMLSGNRQACGAGDAPGENLINATSAENFISIMNRWDSTCEALCRKYCFTGTARQVSRLIRHGLKQIILTGAPGTGKTYTAQAVARALGTQYRIVQFHPAYDYTDFVEGLRPVQLEGDSQSRFVRLDGSFKGFCRVVAEQNWKHNQGKGEPDRPNPSQDKSQVDPRYVDDPDHKYFFIIDEINRANLSQVFGELMLCLEPDKRGRKVLTQYRNLPPYRLEVDSATRERRVEPCVNDVFGGDFFIPQNVYIIGTMNDIDRSVESMDFALRRRFVWHEVEVTEALLTEAFQSEGFSPLIQENAGLLAKRVLKMNEVIRKHDGLNRHYDIAQGQFHIPAGQETGLDGLLDFVWRYRIRFLLEEYVRGEREKDVRDFLDQCWNALSGGGRPQP